MQLSAAASLILSRQFVHCNHASWCVTINGTKTLLIRGRGGRGVLQTNTVGGKLAGSLTAGKTSHAKNRENNSLQTSTDSIIHFLKQYSPVKIKLDTALTNCEYGA